MDESKFAGGRLLGGDAKIFSGDKVHLSRLAERALYASKVTSYAQGFALLKQASKEYEFGFNYAEIARVWRAGCIIRASLLDETFRNVVVESQSAWREVVKTAIDLEIPMMATAASLAYFDAYRSERLPANLIQAQRDFFGAHTYHRVDQEGSFHTKWE